MSNLSKVDISQIGSLQKAWISAVGDIVGAENVQLVTVVFIALLGISVLGFVMKMVKNTITAFVMAVGIVVITSSLGVYNYKQLTPEVVETVIMTAKDRLGN